MYRVVVLSGKPYAREIDDVRADVVNISQFLDTGDVVILCEDLEDLEPFGIEKDSIEIVD